jgi:hypothetical protein
MDNQAILKGKKVTHNFTINAPAEDIFSLVCPLMEYRWIKGWKCKLIYLPNGKNEKDCVFSEIMSAPFLIGNINGKTIWTTVLFDPLNYQVHFKLDNKISSSLYKIEMIHKPDNSTACNLEFTYTPTNTKGSRLLRQKGESKIRFLLEALSTMLKYYSETGKIYTPDSTSHFFIYIKDFTKLKQINLNCCLTN